MAKPELLPEMVSLPGGRFLMGSDSGREEEAPPHEVELFPFRIGRFAVTNIEYQAFVESNPVPPPASWRDPSFCDPRQPAVGISWYEAISYCAWLSRVSGRSFRLPTEAEREYACRAGSSGSFPWGEDARRDLGDYGRAWEQGRPEPAGGPPNGFGLCNMADNVHEWCSDWYARDYYRVSPSVNPAGPISGTRKASRGGSWRHKVKVTRSAARSSLPPDYRYTDYGFRVAGDL